jgi:hypothetical protein
MKPLFAITLFLVMATGAFAQRQNVYFLKNNGNYVDVRDSADYIRIVREPDSTSTLYNIFEFYLNGAKKLTGKSSKINPPQYQGVCVTYYANGCRESVVNYKNGSRAGEDMEFYPNGRLYTEFTYPEGNKDYSPLFDGYLIKTNTDSLGTPQVTNGNGYYRGFDEKFKYVKEEGPVKDGKRDGQWKGDIGLYNIEQLIYYLGNPLVMPRPEFSFQQMLQITHVKMPFLIISIHLGNLRIKQNIAVNVLKAADIVG